ncbi:MAG: adenylate kinase [Clostridia bacterium]|nr:adenylate kinase [Loktanella sp.]MBQ1950545.1 adenylate kinase [Clostridia bacterium]
MNLILLGAPGAGKGTQAEILCDRLQIPTISTGNMIREALKSGTEMGQKAKAYIEAGQLVPDEVVIGIVDERLHQDDCKNGFILDGFPRTIPQAEALDRMGITIDRVVDIHVPDEVITRRVSGRRVCLDCGNTYHVETKKPLQDGVCDRCGSTLVQRKDDQPETVQERLRVYHDQTEPLRDYYEATGKLLVVDGQQDIQTIAEQTLALLKG